MIFCNRSNVRRAGDGLPRLGSLAYNFKRLSNLAKALRC